MYSDASDHKIKIAKLYEKTSAKGTRYFVGRLGAARVLLFQSRETAEGSDVVWNMYLQEVPDRTDARSARGEMPAINRQGNRPAPRSAARDADAFYNDGLDDVLPR